LAIWKQGLHMTTARWTNVALKCARYSRLTIGGQSRVRRREAVSTVLGGNALPIPNRHGSRPGTIGIRMLSARFRFNEPGTRLQVAIPPSFEFIDPKQAGRTPPSVDGGPEIDATARAKGFLENAA